MPEPYERSIFINCPFDPEYRSLFDALVFAVVDCGFEPRCAKEASDSGQVRIDKILGIIRECQCGIHDISRTELDKQHRLPRFNMPLELGLFLGAKEFGRNEQRQKRCLILDREPYRYQKFISDISGQDISAHRGDPSVAIRVVRDWLNDGLGNAMMPSGSTIAERYTEFRAKLPLYCGTFRQKEDELTFVDFRNLVKVSLSENRS